LTRKPDDEFSLSTTLTAAVNSQSSSGLLITSQAATANAIIFDEEVGLGNISKMAALPMGSDGDC